ncbi:hypothetical protein KAR91_58385, partial [Candidatus Pacearchaeota archaeon]|nr:hypothetical protein [Candidatus Pacearchaeota archaeon]
MNRSVRVFALILVLSTLFAPAFCREINAAEGLVVDHVYYSKLSRFDTGTVHTFIKNTGDHPVEIKSITLNGTPLPSDSRDSRLAYWYEVTPNPIAPGSISDCLIKLSSVPPSLIKLEFNTNTGQTLSRIIRPKDNPLRITFIGFNDSLDKIYVYLENRARKPLSLSGIFLNGADVTSSAHIYCSKLSSMQKDLVTISLSASLVPGERVNLKIGTKEGVTAQ